MQCAAEEAIGIARAARKAGMPVVISFTVETDGRLPTGQPLHERSSRWTQRRYAIPPTTWSIARTRRISRILFDKKSAWKRICGVRANASRKSHAELNESPELDCGDAAELGGQYAALKRRLPQLNVLGGCCGTDHATSSTWRRRASRSSRGAFRRRRA